jgi:CheY-like chemotaxis protein
MNKMKIIFIEDDEGQRNIFHNSVEVYEDQHSCKVEVNYAESLEEANEQIDLSFDGAIIDLQLNEEEEGGNKVADNILENFPRIPIIFVTGYPDLVNNDNPLIVNTRARADGTYAEDLKRLWEIYHTGLTRILGGRGRIEQVLNSVFQKNLLPYLDPWKTYGADDPSRTEKALLRFTLNHLIQLLDDDEDQCFPEEVYIYPPLVKDIQTGSVIKRKDSESLYIILSPACDLVVRRDGNFKTDRILLVEIEEESFVLDEALQGIGKKSKKENKLKAVFGNNYTEYFHWLPKTGYFNGGFINFRKISTYTIDEFQTVYQHPHIQISPHFVKDILSRFSSYYARQGQPDIDRNKIIEEVIASSTETK